MQPELASTLHDGTAPGERSPARRSAERDPERTATDRVNAGAAEGAPPSPSAGALAGAARAVGGGDATTVPAPPDSVQNRADGDIGPGGQLVAPWTPGAQLGLDGRAYAPVPSGPDPEGGGSPLGPPHGVLLHEPRQLGLWDRLDVRFGLLAGTLFDRDAKCMRVRIEHQADVPLTRSDRGSWSASGLVRCGHWTCPSCGRYRAREVAGTLGCAMERWLAGSEGMHRDDDTLDVWMLTPTVPHYADDCVGMIVDGLYRAWSHFKRSRTWQRFARTYGVRADVRVLDATHRGRNGCHPHFHVALFVDGAPPGFRHERQAFRVRALSEEVLAQSGLVDAWAAAVERSVGRRPGDDVGLMLSPSEEASSYFTKWGLADEVAGTPIKHDNHLTLLDRAGAGDVDAGRRYLVFRNAVDGRQFVTGLADLRALVGISDDDVAAWLAEWRAARDAEDPPVLVPPLALVVRAHLWKRATSVGIGIVIATAERAELAGEDPQSAVDAFLWAVPARGPRGSPPAYCEVPAECSDPRAGPATIRESRANAR